MRAVLVHDRLFGTILEEQVLTVLRRCLPEAEVREPSPGERLRLAGYDLAISTSWRAAQPVVLPAGTPHLCYIAQCRSVAPRPDAGRGATRLHFVAASRTVSERIALQNQLPCSVIYPPVDTAFYRPEAQSREAFHLLVCRTCTAGDVELAREACRLAQRELVILGELPAGAAESIRSQPGVRCLGPQPDAVVRDHYRRCRGVLVVGRSDFDPAAVEGQACGAPVIAFRHSGTAETVIDAEGNGSGTGWLYDEPAAESVVSTVRELERRPQKCEPALAWANAARFSIARFEREFGALIRDALGRGETASGEESRQQRSAA